MIDAQLRPGRLQLPNIDMSDYAVNQKLTIGLSMVSKYRNRTVKAVSGVF